MLNEPKINETINLIKNSVNDIIARMEDGARIITKDFTTKVAIDTDTNPVIAAGIVSLCIKNSPDAYQRSGRNGGIFKRAAKDIIAQ